jgi:hypothetical protein
VEVEIVGKLLANRTAGFSPLTHNPEADDQHHCEKAWKCQSYHSSPTTDGACRFTATSSLGYFAKGRDTDVYFLTSVPGSGVVVVIQFIAAASMASLAQADS